jgi:hypothetical protein
MDYKDQILVEIDELIADFTQQRAHSNWDWRDYYHNYYPEFQTPKDKARIAYYIALCRVSLYEMIIASALKPLLNNDLWLCNYGRGREGKCEPSQHWLIDKLRVADAEALKLESEWDIFWGYDPANPKKTSWSKKLTYQWRIKTEDIAANNKDVCDQFLTIAHELRQEVESL